jgi:hypothetical protein
MDDLDPEQDAQGEDKKVKEAGQTMKFKPIHSSGSLQEVPMHSHDRTMIAKLGFADIDKGDTRHDLACSYLAQEERILAIHNLLFTPVKKVKGATPWVDSMTEVIIEKGDTTKPQYKTTVGFVDVAAFIVFPDQARHPLSKDYMLSAWRSWCGEVKIKRVGVGDIIRQIKLYKSYFQKQSICPYEVKNERDMKGDEFTTWEHRWFVAVDWELTTTEIETLEREHIVSVRLGPKFDAWAKAQSKKKASVREI